MHCLGQLSLEFMTKIEEYTLCSTRYVHGNFVARKFYLSEFAYFYIAVLMLMYIIYRAYPLLFQFLANTQIAAMMGKVM